MRRSLLVGAAWLLATAVSVLVAYAAVGEVRDRVVDQPQPLSVALSSSTSSSLATGEVTSSTNSVSSTTTAAIGPVSTSTIAPPTDDGTNASSTTTQGTPPTTAPGSEDSEIKTYSTAGGTVSIEVFPDHMVLLGAVPATGYSVAEQEISATQMEIEFKSGEHEIHFKARLNSDGSVSVDVESDAEHDD